MLRTSRWFRIAVAMLILSVLHFSVHRNSSAEDDAFDEAREKGIVERFVIVLEKNPRRGTAFDKIYAYHVERGSMDLLQKTYQERATAQAGVDAARSWMIVGLIAARRGDDSGAISAFAKAESRDESSYLGSYYRGQSLVVLGQSDEAIQAFELALRRSPPPTDLLEIYQSLGRIHQRAQRTKEALAVWSRLESHFPNDSRVQEQIANILFEEGDYAAALPRFENLVQATKDKSRQSQFQVEVAEMKARSGNRREALRDFEKLLSQLNPDNWLHRDIRGRIETMFLRADDPNGLTAYYVEWLTKHPEDLDVISRLSRVLARAGRDAESRTWLEKGLAVAPSNRELRQSLISLLLYEHHYADAAAHFEQLNKFDPNNPDTLREWGRTVLKDVSKDEGTRKQEAAAIWKRLLAARPNDAVAAVQTAELFRKAEMVEQSMALYHRAIELAPDAIQYREYLGEFLQSLNRSDEALAAWREIVAGPRMTAANATRLAEVLTKFGHLDEAVTTNAEACRLDPKNFNLQMRQVDLLSGTDQHLEAIKQLNLVKELAANDEEREAWMKREFAELQSAGLLQGRIAEYQSQMEKDAGHAPGDIPVNADVRQRKADRWYWLARAYESGEQIAAASNAISNAISSLGLESQPVGKGPAVDGRKLEAHSVPILRSAARIYEAHRKLAAAADVNRKLAEIAPRFRVECLKRLTTLENQLGHKDLAMKAGRDLVAVAPGNPEVAEFFSQLCFQLGHADDGILALRRLLRINPGDIAILNRLAAALAEQNRPVEAIEVLWEAFDRTTHLDERLNLVQNLAHAYMKSGQIDRLHGRLKRESRDPQRYRDMTHCLAVAYETSGNLAEAQKTLELLASEDSRDPFLLTQLRRLAERRNDLPTAIRCQRQLLDITKQRPDRIYLSRLMVQAGSTDDAVELLLEVNDSRELTAEVLCLLDSLYQHGHHRVLQSQLESLRKRHPDQWELLYREGVILSASKPLEAARRFEAILAARHPDNEPSLAPMASPHHRSATSGGKLPWFDRLADIPVIQADMNFTSGVVANASRGVLTPAAPQPTRPQMPTPVTLQQSPNRQLWMPRDFGIARLAAWGWLLRNDPELRRNAERLTASRTRNGDLVSLKSVLLDQIAIHAFLGETKEKLEDARKLSQLSEDDVEAAAIFLNCFGNRRTVISQNSAGMVVQRRLPSVPPGDAPYSEDLLTDAIKSYQRVITRPDLALLGIDLLINLVHELNHARRSDEATRLLEAAINRSATREEISHLMLESGTSMDLRLTARLLDRLTAIERLAPPNAAPTPGVASPTAMTPESVAWCLLNGFVSPREELESLLVAWEHYSDWHSHAPIAAPSTPLNAIHGLVGQRITRLPAGTVPVTSQSGISGTIQRNGSSFRIVNGNTVSITNANGNTMNLAPSRPGDIENSIPDLSIHGGLCAPALQVLQVMVERFKRTRRSGELIQSFDKLTKSEAISERQRLLREQGLALVLWDEGRKSDALAVYSKIVDRLPDSAELRLSLAVLHLGAGEPAKALAIAEAINIETTELLQEREKFVLRLTLNTGALERAKNAVRQLLNAQASTQELLPLIQKMIRLGMLEEAEAILRLNPNVPDSLPLQKDLMDLRFAQGNDDQAADMAELLVKNIPLKDTSSQTQRTTGVINGRATKSSGVVAGIDVDEYRDTAFHVLYKTGRLAVMIEGEEAELKSAPDSVPLMRKLLSYYEIAEQQEKHEGLKLRLEEIELAKPSNRYTAAVKFLEANQPDQATRQISILFDKHPDFFAFVCRDLCFRFQDRNELRRLGKSLELADWRRLDNYPEILPFVIDKFEDGIVTGDIAKRMFLKEWESSPENRTEFLIRISPESLWKAPEIADWLRTALIPANVAQVDRQWSLFGRELSQSADGTILITVVSRILDVVGTHKQLDQMAIEVERGLKQWPDWLAGKALLALIDLRRGGTTEGMDSLEKLLPALKAALHSRPYISSEIAREVAPFPSAFELMQRYQQLAIDVLEEKTPTKSLGISAVVSRLVRDGRTSEARRFLIRLLPASVRRQQNSEHPTANDLLYVEMIGRELRLLQFPADAIDLYLRTLRRSTNIKIIGYDPRTTLKSHLTAAFEELSPHLFADWVCLREDGEPGPEVHLLLPARTDGNRTHPPWLQSHWNGALCRVAKEPESLERVRSIFVRLRQRSPHDLATSILLALLEFEAGDESRIQDATTSLAQELEQMELNEKDEHRPAALATEESVETQRALWLVARECLKRPELAAIGRRIGERALQGADRKDPASLAIISEWTLMAKKASDSGTLDFLNEEKRAPPVPAP